MPQIIDISQRRKIINQDKLPPTSLLCLTVILGLHDAGEVHSALLLSVVCSIDCLLLADALCLDLSGELWHTSFILYVLRVFVNVASNHHIGNIVNRVHLALVRWFQANVVLIKEFTLGRGLNPTSKVVQIVVFAFVTSFHQRSASFKGLVTFSS